MATIEEVYGLLEEKENDLQLAGELGKALLEKNDTLTRELDKTAQDYHSQTEVSVASTPPSHRITKGGMLL